MTRRRETKWVEAARRGARPGEDSWLGRALGRAGVIPGGEVERVVFSGRVTVNGVLVRDPLAPLAAGDRVAFDGDPVRLDAPTKVLAYHKPAGSVTAPKDPERGRTVFAELLPQLPPALTRFVWHAVGRLDRATTGLLLFTNDERFVTHATSPGSKLPKRYVARVDGRPDAEKVTRLVEGIQLEDGPARALEAQLAAPGVVELVIDEGRHHQVRRMIDALGLPIRGLHRDAIGSVALDVPEGGWRELSPEEIRTGLGFRPAKG